MPRATFVMAEDPHMRAVVFAVFYGGLQDDQSQLSRNSWVSSITWPRTGFTV